MFKYWVIITMALLLMTNSAFSNQIGVNFSEDAIGALGDYQKTLGAYEFEVDAQAQKSETFSLAGNLSAQRNFGAVGLKPFASYNRDDIGNTLDAGGLINFSKDAIGVLGDVEWKSLDDFDLAADVQWQMSETTTLVFNGHGQHNIGALGIRPFISYNQDEVAGIFDAGAVVNFNYRGLDVAAGASFRDAGVPPDKPKFDAFTGEPLPAENTYTVPQGNNVNLVAKTSVEWRKIEAALTGYFPITKIRDETGEEVGDAPIILISRSQTSIELFGDLSLSLVLDARTYIHSDGAEIAFKPLGAVTYKF